MITVAFNQISNLQPGVEYRVLTRSFHNSDTGYNDNEERLIESHWSIRKADDGVNLFSTYKTDLAGKFASEAEAQEFFLN